MIHGYLETKGKSLENYDNGVKDKFDIKKNIKIVFTEGPNYSLKKWSESEYEDNGLVKVAIKHGAALSRSEKWTRAIPKNSFMILLADFHGIQMLFRPSSKSCYKK